MATSAPSPEVRDATVSDLESILVWLKHEKEALGWSFLCNWKQISEAHESGELRVAIDTESREPIAFLLGDRTRWNEIVILAVKAACQHSGLGTLLVRDYLKSARASGSLGVWGECAPESSEPFWRKMGFEPINPRLGGNGIESRGVWRAMPFRGTEVLRPAAERAALHVQLTSYDYENPPIEEFSTTVARDGSNWILQEHFTRCIPDWNVFAHISINGEPFFRDKVKRIAQVGGEMKPPFVRIRSVVDVRDARPRLGAVS